MPIEFNPMRSLIYINVAKEDYRHKLMKFLYKYHVPESIGQFAPYVSRYAFYTALPIPEDGERFGTYNFQLTEHNWLVNPFDSQLNVKTFKESFTPDVLKWQCIIPDTAENEEYADADDVRASKGNNELPPFIFAFIPMWWEKDYKGAERTDEDGANYRWQFMVKYPKDVSLEEGEQWMLEEVLPKFAEMPETLRILTSSVLQEINGCQFNRVVEIWFDSPSDWHKAVAERTEMFKKPSWATCDKFPYLKPKFEFAGIFLPDYPTSDNLVQYKGAIPSR